MKKLSLLFGLFMLAVFARPQQVSAQTTVRIVVNSAAAPVFAKPDTATVPLRVAKEGSALNVIASEGDWYRIEFQDPQFGRALGYIEKRHVAVQIVPSQEPVDLTIAELTPAPVAKAQPRRMDVPPSSPRTPMYPASAPTTRTYPAWETSAGWGLLRIEDVTMPLAWNASVAGSITPWLSAVGEVGGAYKSLGDPTVLDGTLSVHTFLSGMRFTGRFADGHVNPFGQFLAGVGYARVGVRSPYFGIGSVSDAGTGFAIQPGGGVDIGLSDSIALRMQIDFLHSFDEGASTIFRFAPGIVIRSGHKAF